MAIVNELIEGVTCQAGLTTAEAKTCHHPAGLAIGKIELVAACGAAYAKHDLAATNGKLPA